MLLALASEEKHRDLILVLAEYFQMIKNTSSATRVLKLIASKIDTLLDKFADKGALEAHLRKMNFGEGANYLDRV